MQPQTTSGEPQPEYRQLPKESWQPFFESMTKILEGQRVEIEVFGLDLGDQIQAEAMPLNGLTYEAKDDTFYVYLEDEERGFDHGIPHPREILVHMVGAQIDQVIVVDADDHKHIVRLRQPIELPPPQV